MKKFLAVLAISAFFVACNGGNKTAPDATPTTEQVQDATQSAADSLNQSATDSMDSVSNKVDSLTNPK